jgi:hypothetical protein
MVMRHGVGNIKWSVIAGQMPGRIGKQCRERWVRAAAAAAFPSRECGVMIHTAWEGTVLRGQRTRPG